MYITSLIIEASLLLKICLHPINQTIACMPPSMDVTQFQSAYPQKVNLHLHTKYEDSSLPVQILLCFSCESSNITFKSCPSFSPLLLLSLFPHLAKFPALHALQSGPFLL